MTISPNAYLIETKTPEGRVRFGLSIESHIFPGHATRYCKTWASMRAVSIAAKRNGKVIVEGVNPLPEVTQAMVADLLASIHERA